MWEKLPLLKMSLFAPCKHTASVLFTTSEDLTLNHQTNTRASSCCFSSDELSATSSENQKGNQSQY